MPLGHNELNDIEGVDLLHNLTKHHVQVAIEGTMVLAIHHYFQVIVCNLQTYLTLPVLRKMIFRRTRSLP